MKDGRGELWSEKLAVLPMFIQSLTRSVASSCWVGYLHPRGAGGGRRGRGGGGGVGGVATAPGIGFRVMGLGVYRV